MNHFIIGSMLGIAGFGVALAFGIAPQWAALIGIGIAMIVWLRLYRLDILLNTVFNTLD